MFSWLWKIPVLIYDFFLSSFLTIPAHLIMMQYMTITQGQFLDVGCGTGAPLKKIITKLRQKYSFITGVDLHPGYTKQAIQLFKNQKDIVIKNMDFYELDKLNRVYDFIFFSFSFMLMPDPAKALQVAKKNLNSGGKIAFLMTLNKKVNGFLKKVKPIIKWLTTVDFGNVVLQGQFEQIIKRGNLKIIKKERINSKWNVLLKMAPVYYVQTQVNTIKV